MAEDTQQQQHQRERGPYSLPYDNPYSELGPIVPPHDREDPKYEPSTSTSFFDAIRSAEEGGDDHDQSNRTAQEDADTQNALNQLFNPVTDPAPDENVDQMQLDPTLASEIEAQHHIDGEVIQSPADGGGSGAPAKRKATSRADMLARGGACDFCKRRKLKCSAEVPSCAACRRSGRECVYSQKKQRSKVKLLEDRLVELEKRLGQQTHLSHTGMRPVPDLGEGSNSTPDQQLQHEGGVEANAVFADSVDATLLETPSYHYGVPHINSTFHLPEYEVENIVQEAEVTVAKDHEPDLMTLADAAAGRDAPWESMSPETIVDHVVRAVDGGKGVGEKIISHLMMVYRNAGYIFFLSDLIPAQSLTSRLLGRETPRPHPSLLLSVVAFLLAYSPSPALSSPDRYTQIYALLQPHARTQSMEAMSNPDGRLLDAIVADAVRAMNCYRQAKFLEGWGEGARAAALVWAAGLGKLGGVGVAFLPGSPTGREELVKKERRVRSLIHKGQVIEPPKDAEELGRRISIFWNTFCQDLCAAIGWGWPSNFAMEEITTPFPGESPADLAALSDNYTLNNFFDPAAPTSQTPESDFAALIKCHALLYKANRLFDLSPAIADTNAVERLLAVAKRQEASMREMPPNPTESAEIIVQHGQLLQAWMALYTAMAYLHANKELDKSTVADDDLPQQQCVGALSNVVEYLNIAYEGGDMELESMTLCAQTIWFSAASLAYRLHRRLSALPRSTRYKSTITETKRIGDELVRACHITGKREKYGATTAQLLENIAMGQDVKMGEWERPDNLA